MATRPILYDFIASPGVRAVKVFAKAIDLELELKPVDLLNKKQFSEEFLKLNPTHTVPTLDDNGNILWDSHAIMIYLVEKYAKNDTLYPTSISKRTEINQLLFFDVSVFSKYIELMRTIFYGAVKVITASHVANFEDSYRSIERVLETKTYVTGKYVTIADISLVTTLTSLGLVAPINPKTYPNVTAWIERMEDLPFYEPNAAGLRVHTVLLKEFLAQFDTIYEK